MSTTIWWIRRDLRLRDNPALEMALRLSDQVVPLFILDPILLEKPAEKRKDFLFAGLNSLDADLRKRGSYLVIRTGDPIVQLTTLMQEVGASHITAEEDYTPYARRRDEAVAKQLPLELALGATVHHPSSVIKPDGGPYTVFTPFSKAWKVLPFPLRSSPQPPEHIATPPNIASQALPMPARSSFFPASESEALRRLDVFFETRVDQYRDSRNFLDQDGTSSLSPYFRFGMISARLAAQQALSTFQATASPGAETWLNELIWREFYNAILYHFPDVLTRAYNPSLRQIAWRNVPYELEAWKAGLTGFPIIDASMRQLAATGWMHNRGRMIVASFLVKDLLINWQEGERWFMQQLVDGDPAANNGGWQWTAGVGTDAAPYFRVFNPILQSKKFDPLGRYIRRWVTELQNVPDEYIHEPWLMPAALQTSTGVQIGQNYPFPLVDHAAARERTLIAYKNSGSVLH